MIVGGWLEISTMNGVAGTTQVSLHAFVSNDTYEDRSITLDFRTTADEVKRASMTITQRADNIVVITYNDTAIIRDNTALGYGNNA